MSPIYRYSLLPSLLLVLSACQALGSKPLQPTKTPAQPVVSKDVGVESLMMLPPNIQKWLEEGEYGVVLDWLDTVPHTDPGFKQYNQTYESVKKSAAEYEAKILQEVEQLLKENNQDAVLSILMAALRKLPNSMILIKRRNELFRKEVNAIRNINRQMVIARANYLLKEAQLREQLAQLDWDNAAAQWNMNRVSHEMRQLSDELVACTQQAMEENLLDQAKTCINLSGRLFASAEYKKTAQKLQTALTNANRLEKIQIQDTENKKQQLTALQLDELVKKNLSRGQLREALEIIRELSKIKKDDQHLGHLLKAVEDKLAHRVTTLLKRGNQSYRNGSIEDAKRDWEEALKLDPDNTEAKANVERARRVLDKLHQLKEGAPG